jgi:gamma-glutamyltranspeptidase / glutathione hydrolase
VISTALRMLLRADSRHHAACTGIVLVLALALHGRAEAAQEAIASAHPLATEAGMQVLARGGNAFDAAAAVASTLAVVEPFASGLGGGGFFLLHRAADGFEVMIDARETAPGRARSELYIGADDRPAAKASVEGMKAAAIPGTPAGVAWLAQRYGRMPLASSLAPAIHLARDGFAVDARYAIVASFSESKLRSEPKTALAFLDNGAIPAPGFILRQPELAKTLEAIAAHGRDGFYAGEIARRMLAAVQAGGGVWQEEDLRRYEVLERTPQRFNYRGARITCASLPSAGGLTLAESLQILERFPLGSLGPVERIHLVVEALRRGFQDRARYLGDPEFVQVPDWLGTGAYADRRAATIDPLRATPSDQLAALPEGDNTTHFSVVDRDGNRVAATLSINLPFGAGVIAGDTGVLLNDEMDDFTVAPDTANAFQLVGGSANRIEGRKRPLSSMTPTFVEDARGLLVFGTPGGSRIISMMLLGILAYVDGPASDIELIVSAPRYHHQFVPDGIEYEPGAFPQVWIDALQAMGHTLREGRRRWGNMQAVYVDRVSGEASSYSDPRGKGGAQF